MSTSKGGEPITINATVATGLLTAIEEMYRNKKTGKKGGENKKNIPLTAPAVPLLLTAAEEMYRNKKTGKKGGENKNNIPLTAPAVPLLLTAAEEMYRGKVRKSSKKGGKVPLAAFAVPTALIATREIYRNKMKRGGGGPLMGSPIQTSADLLLPASNPVEHAFTPAARGALPILMGGDKKNRDNQRGGEYYAPIEAPTTILMSAEGQMKLGGGESYASTSDNYTLLMPPRQNHLGGNAKLSKLSKDLNKLTNKLDKQIEKLKNKKTNNKRGGEGEELDIGAPPSVADILGPVSGGGRKKKTNKKRGGEGEELDIGAPPSVADILGPVSGGERKKKHNNKNKKLVGGLAELSDLLEGMSNKLY